LHEHVGTDHEITHITVIVQSSFDQFTKHSIALAGKFDPLALKEGAKDRALALRRLEAMQGEEGLMIFEVEDHGIVLALQDISEQAFQIVIGNPLIAATMTMADIRAGFYAPLRVLVYKGKDGIRIDYDLPSSLFGQFGNPEVTAIGKSLDGKLLRLIEKPDQLGKENRPPSDFS
jgi:uncharacterized protein (DUF302 family)